MAIKNKITASFFIGLFVIIGFILIIGTIIWLGKNSLTDDSKYYATYFDGSVVGLEKGSSVKYLGVPVGTVDHVGVAPDGKLVEIILLIDKGVTIDTNLRVMSEMAGIAGGKFLQLSFPEAKELINAYPKLTFETKYEVIKSAPSGIQEIELAAREVMNNLRLLQVAQISNETLRFLESGATFFENEELYEIVSSLRDASVKFDNILNAADTSKFISNLENTSLRLLETSEQLLAFGGQLSQQLEDLKLTERVDNTFDKVDTTIADARKIINVIGYRSEDILFTLNETLFQIQQTNKQLKKVLQDISNNAGQMLLSEPPPEEE